MDQLTPGRVVTILTRSNGANPGNGLRRKILSVSPAHAGAETITVDTNAYASDGSPATSRSRRTKASTSTAR
jgi:hypothetical protein